MLMSSVLLRQMSKQNTPICRAYARHPVRGPAEPRANCRLFLRMCYVGGQLAIFVGNRDVESAVRNDERDLVQLRAQTVHERDGLLPVNVRCPGPEDGARCIRRSIAMEDHLRFSCVFSRALIFEGGDGLGTDTPPFSAVRAAALLQLAPFQERCLPPLDGRYKSPLESQKNRTRATKTTRERQ